MITVEEKLEVASPASQVWELLSDPRSVVACVPGARLTDYTDTGEFTGAMTVKFGPLRVGFSGGGTLEFHSVEQTGRITAEGRDGRGKTRFEAVASFAVLDAGRGTSFVTLAGEVKITGPLAGTIEGGAMAVVKDMSRQFAESVASRCTPQGALLVVGAEATDAATVAPGPGGIPARIWLRGATSALRTAIRLGVARMSRPFRRRRLSVQETQRQGESS